MFNSSVSAFSSYSGDSSRASVEILTMVDEEAAERERWQEYSFLLAQITAMGPHVLMPIVGHQFIDLRCPEFNIPSLLADEVYKFDHGRTESMPTSVAENWQLLAASPISSELYSRILRLAGKRSRWRGAGSLPLAAQSLGSFLRFWLLVHESAVEPELVLTPQGHLQAEWYEDDKHLLELEFVSTSKVYCGLFDGKSVWEGIGSFDDLERLVVRGSSGPLRWHYDG